MKKYINKLELKKSLNTLKNNIKLSIFTSSIVLVSLTGCSNKEEKTTTEITTEATTEKVTEITTEETTVSTTEEATETTTEITETTTVEKSKDDKIVEFFNQQKGELSELLKSEDVTYIRKKGKEIFTTFVDFIFYDGEIKGITYDELSDGIKEQLYEDLYKIDSVIVEYSPDYKENLADKYNKVKDFISPYYYSAIDKIKEFLGEDNIERLNEIKENGIDFLTDLFDRGKEKIKDKYENWRDK